MDIKKQVIQMEFEPRLRDLIPAILSFIFTSNIHSPTLSAPSGTRLRMKVLDKLLILLLLFSVSAFSQYQWDHSKDIVYVRPYGQGNGVVREPDVNAGTSTRLEGQIVQGQVDFGVQSKINNGNSPPQDYPFPNEIRYQFYLHKPDGNGNDVITPIGQVLTGPNTITWDSNTVPDGSYAIDIRLYSAGVSNESDISRFRVRPLLLIVDNDNSPETGAQWIPSTGFQGMRSRNYDGTGIDWLWYSGTYSLPNAHPYPYTFITPPQTDQERQQLANKNEWFTETMWGSINSRFDNEPTLSRTKEGHIVITGTRWRISKKNEVKNWVFLTDGPRNQGGFMKNTFLTANLRGPGFLGTTYDDRFIFVGPERITTVAGWVTKADNIPCVINDNGCTNQKELHGNFQNNQEFSFGEKTSFIAFDPNDLNKIYITDTNNNRIALVEVNGCDSNYENYNSGYPKVSTFAGQYGVAGYQDGDRSSALFDSPEGMTIVGNTMYIAESASNRIRTVNLNNGQVGTLDLSGFQGTLPSGILVINHDSQGNLIVANDSKTNPILVYKIDLQQNTISLRGNIGNKPVFEVDWKGNVGPIDDIIYVGYNGDHGVGRLKSDGTTVQLVEDGGFPEYYIDNMGGNQGGYPLSLAIDDEESRIIRTHQYRERPTVFRPLKSTDPVSVNVDMMERGLYILHYGTVWEFNQHWQRSSFATIHGTTGHHWLGNNIPLFDDLALMSDSELAAYIKNGMAGHIARPEITGKDLQALIYFIKTMSVSGRLQEFNPETIKQNLAGTEFWPNPNDIAPPTISNINVSDLGNGKMQITWTTNEPSLGLIKYGTKNATITYRTYYGEQEDNYGLFSEIESTYSQQHSLIIENVPSNQQMKFKIISKDKAGNIGKSGEMLFRSPDTSPPSNPTGLNANPVNESQIDLFWNASNDPESGVANYNIYRDNVLVAQPSGTTYSDIGLNENTTYSYEVSAVNGAGLESGKSPSASAATGVDVEPPTIISAGIGQSLSEVNVKYSEPVEENSATNVNNYGIDNGINVLSASLAADLRTVNLSASSHSPGGNYILTVNNIRDRASNPNTIADDTQVNYTAPDSVAGDVIPPTIISAGIGQSLSEVNVKYSEPVEENSATNVNNYGIDNGINVLSASLAADLRTVNLSTSSHSPGDNYILTVNNIRDRASNPNTIADDTRVNYIATDTTDTTGQQASIMNLIIASGEVYEISSDLDNGDQAFIDRNFAYNGLPDSLTGNNMMYIRTANDDKLSQGNLFLTFDIATPLTIYIAHDDRYQIKPDWLTTFTNTGHALIIGNESHTLFKKTYPVGQVVLGGNVNPSEPEDNNMYTVIISKTDGDNPPVGVVPTTSRLSQNYPNPFPNPSNPSTRIAYELARGGHVELKVFDLLGREVAVLVDDIQSKGEHFTEFDGGNLSSGVYVYHIQAGDFSEAKKMFFIK